MAWWTRQFGLGMALVLAGCAIAGPSDDEVNDENGPVEPSYPEEPNTPETAMAEANFDRHDVLDTASMVDADAMTVAEVQAFLDNNPYGWTSVLASHVSNGHSAAQAFVDAGQANGINPLVLLTRVQMEQSLIGKTSAPLSTLKKAMGCGCPDNKPCQAQYKGFDKQVDCAASKLRSYLDDMDGGGTTIAGWGVGISKTTLDSYSVTPVNEATAALYTYTPWVSAAKAHAKIWALYAAHVGYTGPSGGGTGGGGTGGGGTGGGGTGGGDGGGGGAGGGDGGGPLDVVIEDDAAANTSTTSFEASPGWIGTSATPGHHGSGYAYRTTGASSDLASFRMHLDAPATVTIEGWWTAGGNRASAAPFIVYDGTGNHLGTIYADQTSDGSQWVELGTFAFSAGWNTVALSRWTSSGSVVIADAVRVTSAP
jgi:uncharacterized membrane protein YgcG